MDFNSDQCSNVKVVTLCQCHVSVSEQQIEFFQCLLCILDQKTRLCVCIESVVTCTSWVDEPVQECTCIQVQSVLLWSPLQTRLIVWSQVLDCENLSGFLRKVQFCFAVILGGVCN